jgi:hypothetical protein
MAIAVPFGPSHVSVYVVSAFNPLMTCDPRLALAPDQPPDAVHAFAFAALHSSVVLPLAETEPCPLRSDTCGVPPAAPATTLTVTRAIEPPPDPEQFNV